MGDLRGALKRRSADATVRPARRARRAQAASRPLLGCVESRDRLSLRSARPRTVPDCEKRQALLQRTVFPFPRTQPSTGHWNLNSTARPSKRTRARGQCRPLVEELEGFEIIGAGGRAEAHPTRQSEGVGVGALAGVHRPTGNVDTNVKFESSGWPRAAGGPGFRLGPSLKRQLSTSD